MAASEPVVALRVLEPKRMGGKAGKRKMERGRVVWREGGRDGKKEGVSGWMNSYKQLETREVGKGIATWGLRVCSSGEHLLCASTAHLGNGDSVA